MKKATEKNRKKRTIVTATFCIAYLLLTSFYHHIDKYLTGVTFIILTALIPILFLVIFLYAIKGILQVFEYEHKLILKPCLPAIISISILLYSIFSPYRLNSESLESRVTLRACFEGTQNQAFIKFRENNTFELNWTGIFGADKWYIGSYSQKADTFYLNYTTDTPSRFGDTIINNGNSLITINKTKKDSKQYFVPFYLGYCKGLN